MAHWGEITPKGCVGVQREYSAICWDADNIGTDGRLAVKGTALNNCSALKARYGDPGKFPPPQVGADSVPTKAEWLGSYIWGSWYVNDSACGYVAPVPAPATPAAPAPAAPAAPATPATPGGAATGTTPGTTTPGTTTPGTSTGTTTTGSTTGNTTGNTSGNTTTQETSYTWLWILIGVILLIIIIAIIIAVVVSQSKKSSSRSGGFYQLPPQQYQ